MQLITCCLLSDLYPRKVYKLRKTYLTMWSKIFKILFYYISES